MSFFGIGGWELLLVFIIMLTVAGPRRMISWAYELGKFLSKMREMWDEVVDVLQLELDEAGVDIKIPKDVPTKQNLNKWASESLKPLSNPIQDAMDDIKEDVKEVRAASKFSPVIPVAPTSKLVESTEKAAEQSQTPTTTPATDANTTEEKFGAWSGQQENNVQGEQKS